MPCNVEIGKHHWPEPPYQARQVPATRCSFSPKAAKATTTNGGGSGTDFASNQPHWLITNVYKNSTYELTVTSEACGLAATATMTVTVNQGASIAGISGGGTYCHGSEVTLFANNRSHGNGNVRTLISGLRVLFVLSALVAGPFTITLVSSFANGRLLSPNPSSFFSIQAVTVAAANINVVAANHFDIKCTHLTRWDYKVQCVNFAGSRLPLVRPRWFCSNLPNPYIAYATEGNAGQYRGLLYTMAVRFSLPPLATKVPLK